MKQPISIAELEERVRRLLLEEKQARDRKDIRLPMILRNLDRARSQLFARKQIG